MLARSLISKMNAAEKTKFRDGAYALTFGFGAIAYFNYR